MPGSYAYYLTWCRPAKVNEGRPHPDEIVESALLAHVSPPDITYKHHLEVTLSRPHSVVTGLPPPGLVTPSQCYGLLHCKSGHVVYAGWHLHSAPAWKEWHIAGKLAAAVCRISWLKGSSLVPSWRRYCTQTCALASFWKAQVCLALTSSHTCWPEYLQRPLLSTCI